MSRKGPEPYFLNIAPLLPGHEEALAADIADLAACRVITHNAFCCTLTPEGDPMFDKASELAKRFSAHRAALRKRSTVPCGILIQATVGHGWTPNIPSPGLKFLPGNGPERYIFCPLGKEFRTYIAGQIRTLAACKPDFFMLDDDFRMLTGRGGCFCEEHIAGFSRLTGQNYTAESLQETIRRDETVARAYDAWLRQTLEELARIIRGAMDQEAPGIPCSYCICAQDIRHAVPIGRILQGNGGLRLRINNGFYMEDSVRAVPGNMLRSARQALYLPEDAELLDEPDTCPQNRYSTSAAVLHDHLTRAMLSNYGGAKLWITRFAYEPASGRAYRTTLKRHASFYRALFALGFREDGILSPLPSRPPFNFPACQDPAPEAGSWFTQTGVMGFPFRLGLCSSGPAVSALSGDDCDQLTDDDVRLLFDGDLILDGSAALKLTRRGFAGDLGVSASEWGELPSPSFEAKEDGSGFIKLSRDSRPVRLAPGDGVPGEILTWISHRTSDLTDDARRTAPGAIRLTRPDGHALFVMAASLRPFSFSAFSYLNETRKAQFAAYWSEKIPVYYDGDAEMMTQTGRDAAGRRIVVLSAVSPEGVVRPRLVFREPVRELERLTPGGVWEKVAFTADGPAVVPEIEVKLLFPEVLRIRRGGKL
ncbi:MAG: hypothetical protein IJS01_08305 [Lentisphaeria bacterium]|nr:hypothetical protein [Lentisphaeria bacterium]